MASNAELDRDETVVAGKPRRARARLVVALALLLCIAALAAFAWALFHWQGNLKWRGPDTDPAARGGSAGALNAADPVAVPTASPASTRPPALVMSAEQQGVRMLDIEQRLTRVAVAAQTASSYANRAEAMMIAFAARRSLDAGAPLGYVEGQLRLLFGDAQPKAVATIVNAAAEPVTITDLRAGLDRIRIAEAQGEPDESWWDSLVREVQDLAVIRPAGSPSPDPEERIARARLQIESGRIESAIGEVAALRQQAETVRWLEQARRYNEAHRALDVIEAAAILEPRMVAPALQPPTPTAPAPPRPPRR